MDMIEQRTGQPGVNVFKQALSEREAGAGSEVGGASAARPIRCRSKCGPSAAPHWGCAGSFSNSRARKEKTMAERLAAELILASKGEGETIKKKEDTHRMAEANRAFRALPVVI